MFNYKQLQNFKKKYNVLKYVISSPVCSFMSLSANLPKKTRFRWQSLPTPHPILYYSFVHPDVQAYIALAPPFLYLLYGYYIKVCGDPQVSI